MCCTCGADQAANCRREVRRNVRKPIAILAVLVWLFFWIVGASLLGSRMTDWNQLIQLLFYVIAGIGWIFPLRPLFRWMNANETGPED